jgi:hypothetical protein
MRRTNKTVVSSQFKTRLGSRRLGHAPSFIPLTLISATLDRRTFNPFLLGSHLQPARAICCGLTSANWQLANPCFI